MKICFITYNIFDLGGIQRVTSVIANEISKEHEVDILCTSGKYKIDRSLYNLSENINVEINEDLKRKNKVLQILYRSLKEVNKITSIFNKECMLNILTELYYPKKIRKRFIKHFNDKEYDIVIGVAGEYSLLLGTIANDINAKTIGWQHNSFDAYLNTRGRYFWNQGELFKKYIGNLNKHIVLTEYDRDMYKRNMNIDSDVIYNPRSFNSVEKSNLKNNQFLAAGRFTHQKGFDLLIESFNEFSKINTEWNLVMVGDGEEKKHIKQLINKYDLSKRIKIENFTNDIKSYFLESSILLLPSRWEGMPMIVLEALEIGVPIISYDITASQQLIENNKEGVLVNKFNSIEFSNAMVRIANSLEDRYNMSKNAIEKSKMFSVNEIVKEWSYMFKTI